MTAQEIVFTSESVTEGHPDKIADQISDGILDAILAQDPNARVACETLITTGLVVIAGEITTTADVDYQAVARKTINEIGYNNGDLGFDGNACAVLVALDKQSPDIAQGVDTGHEIRTAQAQSDALRPGRRRRPGHDVRLRDPRDPRAHADADRPGPPLGQATVRGSQERHAALPASRRQDPGHHPLPRRCRRRYRQGPDLDPAR